MSSRPEISYLIQNVLPIMASQFGFPLPEDEERVKIDEIPVKVGSGVQKPDVVYFWDGVPVFIIEAKKPNRSEEEAVKQALSYIRNFPVSTHSKDSIRPKYFAVTMGANTHFYAYRFEIKNDNLEDGAEKLPEPIAFEEILELYGLKKVEKKKVLEAKAFRADFLNELIAIYKPEGEKITKEVLLDVSSQVLNYLKFGSDYTSREPYISLDHKKDRQAQIRVLFNKFDLVASLGPDFAREFRIMILRAFQGTQLNQYLTEKCVIDFMVALVGKIETTETVLDFECGSGGFLAAVLEKYNLPIENIRGYDIDDLPFVVAKTYLAIYFKLTGKEIDEAPIKEDNGLVYHGSDWDVVLGNPAGASKYEHGHLTEIFKSLESDLDQNGRCDSVTEYNLSVQQAVNSAKIGGRIALILPEGFFSNSGDEVLRHFVSKYCEVKAIISLPRGVFKKGTDTNSQGSGSQQSTQKMSILYCVKKSEVIKGSGVDGGTNIDYLVFMANIEKPESATSTIEDWLEPELALVLKQCEAWHNEQKLDRFELDRVPAKAKVQQQLPTNKSKIETNSVDVEEIARKIKEMRSETKISDDLKDLF